MQTPKLTILTDTLSGVEETIDSMLCSGHQLIGAPQCTSNMGRALVHDNHGYQWLIWTIPPAVSR